MRSYPRPMSIAITYKSALELLRLPEFPQLAATWDERTGHVPEHLPTAEDVRRIIRENPALQKLSTPLHLLVSSDNNPHSTPLVTRHVSRASHPRDAFVRVGEDVYVSSPELLPFQMARVCNTLEEALLISELCGTYAVTSSEDGMVQRRRPLTRREHIDSFLRRMGHGYGTRKVRAGLPLSCSDSGSPYESRLALRYRGPREDGGYELEFFSMNEVIELEPIGRALDELQVRKPDILFLAPPRTRAQTNMPFRGVAVDYKGKIHDDPDVAERDDRRRNELLAHGIKPYEIRKRHYDDLDYMDALVQRLRRDLGLPPLDLSYGYEERQRLHDELEAIDGITWSGDRRVPRTYDNLV